METTELTVPESFATSPDEFDVDPPYDSGPKDFAEDRFLDRELSWLAFNARVLELAADSAEPLLERIRFISITFSIRCEAAYGSLEFNYSIL